MTDLEQYDDDAKPATSRFASGLDQIKDGEYDFEVASAVMKTTTKDNTPLCSFKLVIISEGAHAGAEVERASFVKDRESFNVLLGDFRKLGFDSDDWTKANGRPASQEVDKAVKVAVGMRFRGKKHSNASKKDNKVYHNLDILKRIEDGKPVQVGKKELDAADKDPF